MCVSTILFSCAYKVCLLAKYHAGNCFVDNASETWEERIACRIIRVGHDRYLYECPTTDFYPIAEFKQDTKDIVTIDSNTHKVTCPIGF